MRGRHTELIRPRRCIRELHAHAGLTFVIAESCAHRPQRGRLVMHPGARVGDALGRPEGFKPPAQDDPRGVHVGVRLVAAVMAVK